MAHKEVHLAFLGLLILLAATVGVSYIELGIGNELFAYGFAVLKALIILIVFMSFSKDSSISKLYFFLALFGIFLLVVFILDDVVFRP